jgi:hypothetical protein
MDNLEQAFGPAEEVSLVFTYNIDTELGGTWLDLDPEPGSKMPIIDIHRRNDGIFGIRIHTTGNIIDRLVAFIPATISFDELHVVERVAGEIIRAVFGVRNEVVIFNK